MFHIFTYDQIVEPSYMPMDGNTALASSPSLMRLINEADILTHNVGTGLRKSAVESLMRLALPYIKLGNLNDTEVNARGYARKLLYSHPEGRFSVLALKWLPGACTPVHGHNAWGCVGVLDGEIGCETFAACDEPSLAKSTGIINAKTGAVASVDPNPCGIHRLFNPTERISHTLHIYGMDLSENPCAINVPYRH